MNEVWEIAEVHVFPFTSNQIAYDESRETILAAIMETIGHPLDKRRCPICVKTAVDTLKRLKKKEMAKKKGGESKRKYVLKDIRVGVLGYSITRDECTDEIAKEILRKNPAFIVFFSEFPSDWENDIKQSGNGDQVNDDTAEA